MHAIGGVRRLVDVRWATLALVVLATVGLGLTGGGGVDADEGPSTPAQEDALSKPLPPCPPVPGPYDGRDPPHPYQPGDPICSAEGTGVFRADVRLSRDAGALALMQKNVGVWTWDPGLAGLAVSRSVSNPSLGSDDTQYHTMHAGRSGKWIEIGWAKRGSGTPELFVASHTGYWSYTSEYPISPGQTINVQIDNYPHNNSWRAELWWNGTWRVLKTIDIGTIIAEDANVIAEMFTQDSNWPTLPTTWIYDTQLLQCLTDCRWKKWDTSIGTTAWGDWPYHAHFTNYYYKWYAHRH